MMKTRHNILSGLTAEQVSTRVLVALVVLAVVVFDAFFLIGYDVPFEDNPEFNAPRLTDLVLVFIYVLVLLAAILAVTAIAISLKARDKAQGRANNIPSAKIAWGTAGLLVASLLATFLLGDIAGRWELENDFASRQAHSAATQHHVNGRHIVHLAGVLPYHDVNGR